MQRNGIEQASLLDSLIGLWRELIGRLRNPYRPERHYMRGRTAGGATPERGAAKPRRNGS